MSSRDKTRAAPGVVKGSACSRARSARTCVLAPRTFLRRPRRLLLSTGSNVRASATPAAAPPSGSIFKRRPGVSSRTALTRASASRPTKCRAVASVLRRMRRRQHAQSRDSDATPRGVADRGAGNLTYRTAARHGACRPTTLSTFAHQFSEETYATATLSASMACLHGTGHRAIPAPEPAADAVA